MTAVAVCEDKAQPGGIVWTKEQQQSRVTLLIPKAISVLLVADMADTASGRGMKDWLSKQLGYLVLSF